MDTLKNNFSVLLSVERLYIISECLKLRFQELRKIAESQTLKDKRLLYVVELYGNVLKCLEAEAIKIYTYPKLPENLKRTRPLIRPPGNKVDL